MAKAKVLFLNQEIYPYIESNPIADMGRQISQGMQERGKEIRTFMPRYGCINERRHQLHEVIRLSGQNIIMNDADIPLIIKVASIQAYRMQIYFIDNDEYFRRKEVMRTEDGAFIKDNDERAVFYARGVLETVKNLGWSPDIVHCNGFISCMAPMYLKRSYKDNPLFSESKVIYSLYDDEFSEVFDADNLYAKAKMDGIAPKDVKKFTPLNYINMNKMAIYYADAVIMASENIKPELQEYAKKLNKKILPYSADTNYLDAYSEFFDHLLGND